MHTAKNVTRRGFTLIELIAVIVVLAILSAVAIPRYFDYAASARSASAKSILGSVRSAVANFYANSIISSGTPAFPTLAQLQTPGTVMTDPVPVNPYNSSQVIAAGTWTAATAGTPAPSQTVSGTNGWNYDAAAGKFWANSNTSGVGENAW
jgi:prepilin-type N-terminal cleavage/methylation domain-containing protein